MITSRQPLHMSYAASVPTVPLGYQTRPSERKEALFFLDMSPSETDRESGAKLNDSAARESQPRQDVRKARPPQVGPRHYHLLWDEELDVLRPVLSQVSERLGEVVEHWYQLYVLHFGDRRALSEPEFRDFFYNALSRNTKDLLDGDMDRYAIETIRTGEMLCERNVPFAEIVASLHLYEESAYTVFPKDPPPPLGIYTAFDKLSHIRMILLATHTSAPRRQARAQGFRRSSAKPLCCRGRNAASSMVWRVSAVMRRLYERIEAAGRTRGTILIVGESGTGKELVARAI